MLSKFSTVKGPFLTRVTADTPQTPIVSPSLTLSHPLSPSDSHGAVVCFPLYLFLWCLQCYTPCCACILLCTYLCFSDTFCINESYVCFVIDGFHREEVDFSKYFTKLDPETYAVFQTFNQLRTTAIKYLPLILISFSFS